MAGANRPGFTPNVQANMRTISSNRIFVDLKPDSTLVVRFLPPCFEDGSLFMRTMNHYNFLQPDDANRGMAMACLREHGTEETGEDCFVCWLVETAEGLKNEDAAMKKIASNQGGHPVRPRWYSQVLIGGKNEDTGAMEYYGPKMLALPKSASEEVIGILQSNKDLGEPFFTDPDQGQALYITRTGSGLKTRYRVERSGLVSSLDDIMPDWTDKFMDADTFYSKLALNVMTPDAQKDAAKAKHGETVDWAKLEAEFGL